MTIENPHVVPLLALVRALEFQDAIFIETPSEVCAQVILKITRRPQARKLVVTCGVGRVMWTVIHDGVGSLYGDHRRGKTPIPQIASAINATIDRSFAQP